jgi:hypothetical protein
VFIELIGGDDGPAKASVEAALSAGKAVVTANKALLARHGVELAHLAEERGVTLGFEAAVAGGIPVIKALREALAGNEIRRVYGILNGTCNYILTKMQDEHRAFADVLKEAQDKAASIPPTSLPCSPASPSAPASPSTRSMSRASRPSPRPTSRRRRISATASSCSAWRC